MKPSQVIREAIPHMQAGWCRGALEDDFGNVCALGALGRVLYGSWNHAVAVTPEKFDMFNQACCALDEKAAEITNNPFGGIVEYNNHVAPDVDDMVQIFEKTAAGLEEQGR